MHPRPLESVLVTGPVQDVARALRAALDGSGPAVAPVVGAPPGDLPGRVPDGVALVLTTSGSTGVPRRVLLDADAVLASAHATHARLGGPGRWVLTLPAQHVAGLQVIVRSLLAGGEPVVVPAGHFDPVATAAAIAAARGDGPLYGSVVPTQLHRILADGVPDAARAAWAGLDAVLVGGAAAAPALLDRARAAGIRVVTTYGMTETAGGCVYDGVPLDGVRVRVSRGDSDGDGDGIVQIAGPVLARGYLPPDDDAFVLADGERWFCTSDVGEMADGVLRVRGRADDVVVSGGVNVVPSAVEAVLAGLGLEACVVGVPDEEWGQIVTAVVASPGAVDRLSPGAMDRSSPGAMDGSSPGAMDGSSPGAVDVAVVRAAVAARLGAAAAPRSVIVVDALPRRGPGKVDRAAVARLAAAGGP